MRSGVFLMPKEEGVAEPPARTGFAAFMDIGQDALDAIPVALCVCSPPGEIVRFNRRAAELWGWAPERDTSADRHDDGLRLYTPEGTPLTDDRLPMAALLCGGQSLADKELLIVRPDGTRVPVRLDLEVLAKAGQVQGAIACFRLASAEDDSETALRWNISDLQSIIDRTPFMLVGTGRDLRYRFVSRAYAEMFGLPREAIVGKSIRGGSRGAGLQRHSSLYRTGSPG